MTRLASLTDEAFLRLCIALLSTAFLGSTNRRGTPKTSAAFVGTLWSVGDTPARTFTEEFYRQLKHQKATIAAAASTARAKAKKAGDATWLAYVVYGNPAAKLSLVKVEE